ncbi:MAG: carboxylesterase/lipase family protein, partial [Gemmataceae bacterium]
MRAKSEKRRVITETVLAAAGAICAIAIGAPAIAKPNLPSPTVQTADGPVTGTVTDTIGTFLGIPYAAPPAGSLRWMPPQPPTPWTTPLDATQFGSECPQEGGSTDEDCLFLNVYVPTKALEHARSHRYPVMFWVHGGGYTTGAGGYEDPTRLVTMGNVIVVTINYRLGALGFLAHPALSAESPYGGSGNYGIMDQQFAMQWVQQNIAAFGGNPKNVTIFGESAGGNSMFVNLVSPTAAGLFRRMIIESGSYEPVLPTLSGAEAAGMTFAGDVGCGDQTAACLRSVPVQTLLNNQPVIGILLGLVLTPNIDGYVLPESIGTALAGGDFNRVPVIDGTNHDEFRGYVALLFDLIGGPITTAEYPSVVGTLAGVIVGGNGPAILAEYPSADYPSPDLALGTWVTDYLFSCHALQADDSMVKFTQTRACEFADENAPVNGMPPVSFPYGAYHSAELQYLSGATPNPAFTSDQVELSDRMISYWTRFAKNGNPGEGWKPLSRTGDGFFESLVPPVPRRETVSA